MRLRECAGGKGGQAKLQSQPREAPSTGCCHLHYQRCSLENGCCGCYFQNESSTVCASSSHLLLIQSLRWVHLTGQSQIMRSYPCCKALGKQTSGLSRFCVGRWAVSYQELFSMKFPIYKKTKTWTMEMNQGEGKEREIKEKQSKCPAQRHVFIQLATVFIRSPTNTSNSACPKMKSPLFTPNSTSYSLSFLGI